MIAFIEQKLGDEKKKERRITLAVWISIGVLFAICVVLSFLISDKFILVFVLSFNLGTLAFRIIAEHIKNKANEKKTEIPPR